MCNMFLWLASSALALTALPVEPGSVPESPTPFSLSLDGMWRFFPAFEEIETNHAFLQEGPGNPPAAEKTNEDKHYGWMNPAFDDSLWWDIEVPGSWNTQFEDLWSYEGQGWYRRRVFIPREWADRYVEFVSDGANYRTALYVNGTKAGAHEGGYTQFSFPVHELLRFGEENVFAVSVDNKSLIERVPMERHDWWHHGGLYRPVRLVVRERTHIRAVTIATDALAEPALVRARIEIAQGAQPGAALYAVARLNDAGRTEAASARIELPAEPSPAEITLPVPDARRWSPDEPYLYGLTIELREAKGDRCHDTWQSPVGIRTVTVTADHLMLNGKPILIKGVNRYENYPGSGMTTVGMGLERDLALIKELGANAVRCHYPYSKDTYDALDQWGFLAVCEVPLYQWGRIGHSTKNLDAAKAQLEEMILTLGNHPSIILWSVSNENRIHPREKGKEYEQISRMVAKGNLQLVDLAHELDPTRPVIEPSNEWPKDVVLDKTDLNSVNVYLGVDPPDVRGLSAAPERIRSSFAELRERHPGKPILVTEFGSWALRGLMTSYFPGEPFQAELLKTEWETFTKEPGFAGAFIWCFADSDVHRKYTRIYEMRCAYGLFDLHRRPKAGAQTVKAMWSAADSPQQDAGSR
ncbi:MAG TPA: glycoside hydrolase family 2 TIM barrel-domain containing protein [Candidatus Hydrogenedentes bacterium]|nr:glycoside hydrolase family 2 TIM barrel-domain containing protein [Candidatus Hydrogenedentota bacterium]HQM49516.1 glycoside hydrolase family 2 TIM barrel-domain containing protein [Candidatus Hydrogenedentota bacterium]